MPDSLASSSLIANPTLSANPRRYSHHDGNNINRFIQQLRFVLPWKSINGQYLDVLGHDPESSGVQASFYPHDSQTNVPIPLSGYDFAPLTSPASHRFALKEINASFDQRIFSQQLLSRQINQKRHQYRALKHAICSRLEDGLINGDSSSTPAEFDGLRRLVDLGMGQRINASASDRLDILNQAMTQIRSHSNKRSAVVMSSQAWLRVLELQRAHGFQPRFYRSRRLRQRILHLDGVPVYLSDHIATDQGTSGRRTTSIFFLSFGRNGVFGILSRRKRGIRFTSTRQENLPVRLYQASIYCGLGCYTSDSLVEVSGWNVDLGE